MRGTVHDPPRRLPALLIFLGLAWPLAAFGGRSAAAAIAYGIACLLLLVIARPPVGGAPDRALNVLALAVVVQCVPLPRSLVALLSPHREPLHRMLSLADAPSAWPTLTIDRPSTLWALAVLLAAVAVFWLTRDQLARGGVRRTARTVSLLGAAASLLAIAQAAMGGLGSVAAVVADQVAELDQHRAQGGGDLEPVQESSSGGRRGPPGLGRLSRLGRLGRRSRLRRIGGVAAGGYALDCASGGPSRTSGPGLDLKSEALGLAISLELPMVVVDVQRAGPSTGMPTKTEQTDLLAAMFGRHGEAPLPVLAPRSPTHCFDIAIEATRLAVTYRTPVIVLSDGFLALPGGIGTLEEFFETWTWAQLGLHAKPFGILDVAGFYGPLLGFLDRLGRFLGLFLNQRLWRLDFGRVLDALGHFRKILLADEIDRQRLGRSNIEAFARKR